MTDNQNPEQQARDNIDALLKQAGWVVQSAKKIDLNAGLGQAVREYQTDVGPADFLLFVGNKAVGVIEAKKEDLAHKITEVEMQTAGYAAAKLKWVNNKEPLPFLYESTGIITRFTDGRDPKLRSREVFSFHRPETLKEWLSQGDSLPVRPDPDGDWCGQDYTSSTACSNTQMASASCSWWTPKTSANRPSRK
jgi:type I restriction enzyme R subunit